MSDKYPGGFVTTGAPAGFSVALDGSGDYLSLPSPINFGTNAFTIEGWFYMSTTGQQGFWGESNGGGANPKCQLYIYPSNSLTLDVGTGPVSNISGLTASSYLKLNSWNHIVACRAGTGTNQTSLFINGVRVGNGTSGSVTGVTDNFKIGSNELGVMSAGYISSFRVINGTDIYGYSNTTITPQGGPFLQSTNAILLACQSPTIIDNSASPYTITAYGDAKVSNFTPFAGYQGFNPALGAAAGGVWTLDEAAYYQQNRQWPIYDPYFKNTTLMLHGNGTNAAQNNTFLDSSTNNFTITRNGNTTQGTFTPFSQTGWSYNGTAGAYCQLNNADYAIGTGNFTIEFWMYCVDDSSYSASAFAGLPGAAVLTVSMTSGSSNARLPYLEFGGAGTTFGALSGYLNRWTHIAFVRTSGNVVVYQNGVATAAPISKSASFPNCANLVLARLPTDTGQDFRGYLSNFRITKAAVYSSNFTPSTAPFAPITNTVLLAFQDNRFVDNSALRATVTPAGTASVQAFSPFVPAYITPTTYSNYFSGSGSYLTGVSNAALVFGTGTYTIEMWVYQTARSGTQYVLGGGGGFQLAINSSGFIFGGVAGVGDFTAATVAVSLSTWTHIVIVRNSTSAGGVAYYVNGVAAGTATDANNYTTNVTLNIATTNSNVGVSPFTGCLSNLRVIKGTALYTSAFTPPTAPLTAITNTSLLTCQNSTFVDNSTNALALSQVGTPQPVTSPTPFAPKVDQTTLNSAYSTSIIGGSAYFDGTGDYLTGTGNTTNSNVALTIEAWVYFTGSTGSRSIFSNMSVSGGTSGVALATNPSGYIVFARGNGGAGINVTSSTPTYVNTWYHFAAVRTSGGAITLFQNGVIVATGSDAVLTDRTSFIIGGAYTDNTANNPQGYIASLRVTTGGALYASAFSPSFAPFTTTVSSGTVSLLTNFTNGAIFDNSTNNVWETVSNAQISTAQNKYGGSSMLFNGTSDYLKAISSPSLILGTGDFTIEMWVYPTSWANANAALVQTNGGSNGPQFGKYGSNNNLGFCNAGVAWIITDATLPTTNTWTHVAVTRAGTTVKIFVNGVQSGSTATSSANFTTALQTIGANNNTEFYGGYIDDLRVTKGYARYTTNFTPPTSQLQDQ